MTELDAEDLAARLSDRTPAGIAEQIGQLIAEKLLPADSRLPTVRDLAQELGVSVGTIAQAWSLLREQGLVETRRRGGTRVLPHTRRRAEDFAGPGAPLEKLGFLTAGLLDPADPAAGYEQTLRIIALGEQLGLDSVWLRHRSLQQGVSSAIAVLAAASQRTSRIGLSTADTPLDLMDPLQLAEDLVTVDLLSGGRFNAGFSLGEPERDTTGADQLVDRIAGELTGASEVSGEHPDRAGAQAPGLRSRLWCSAETLTSAQWAGQRGLHLLSSSALFADDAGDSPDAAQLQAEQIRAFRAAYPEGNQARAAQTMMVIPTDSATREQETKYRAYAGEQMPGAPDLIGTSDEIAEALLSHAGYLEVDEAVMTLPLGLAAEDYTQILTDIATRVGPALGWKPRSAN